MNNVINGLVEVGAYVVTFFVLNRLGRRLLTAGPLLFAGASMLGGMLLTQYATDENGDTTAWAKVKQNL
mgnify:CR=1 FL=1